MRRRKVGEVEITFEKFMHPPASPPSENTYSVEDVDIKSENLSNQVKLEQESLINLKVESENETVSKFCSDQIHPGKS